MISETFDRLFERLVGCFKRYQDAPRVPETVVELATARWDLHLARADIATERHRVHSGTGAVGRAPVRHTDVSDDDLARLRVFGVGFVEG